MPSKKSPTNFAKTLSELETLTKRLEDDNTPLEQSLIDFEAGIQLIRQAQKALQEAEQKVQVLLEQDDEPVMVQMTDNADKDEGSE